MYEFKVHDKTYKVKFGYYELYQNDLMDKFMTAMTGNSEDAASAIKNLIGLTGELLLAGLQYYHDDEFGYDAESPTERKQMLRKVCRLIDEYEDENRAEDKGGFDLFNDLQAELEKNNFLSKITKAGEEAAAEQNATVIPTDHLAKKRSKAGANK